jgi:hypothetical protein
MQTPVFSAPQSRFKVFTSRRFNRVAATELLDTRLADFVRNLFVSSLLWVLLAVTVYTVYSMFAGSH